MAIDTEIRKREKGLKGLFLQLGVNGAVVAAIITWVLNAEKDRRNEIMTLKHDVINLKSKMETDAAQWRVIQRLDQGVSDNKTTSSSNERILDKILTDVIEKGRRPLAAKEKKTIDIPRILGFKKEPPLVIWRAPNREKTVKQYRQQKENEYQQQMQQQVPVPKAK